MNNVEFVEKKYGYKVLGEYGDKIGKIDTDFYPTFSTSHKWVSVNIEEMKKIVEFMEQLECRNVSL